MRARGFLWLALALAPAWGLATACGGDDETAQAVPENVQADVGALARQILEDPAQLSLQEVDGAIRDERPVLAADLIAQGARPATERQIALLRALSMSSAEGRRLRARAVRLYRDRLAALDALAAALSRGIGQEDEQLLAAMHADAEAQVAIVALQAELDRIVPSQEERPLEERGAPPRLPSRDDGLGDDPPSAERPAEPNPSAAEPLVAPEPK